MSRLREPAGAAGAPGSVTSIASAARRALELGGVELGAARLEQRLERHAAPRCRPCRRGRARSGGSSAIPRRIAVSSALRPRKRTRSSSSSAASEAARDRRLGLARSSAISAQASASIGQLLGARRRYPLQAIAAAAATLSDSAPSGRSGIVDLGVAASEDLAGQALALGAEADGSAAGPARPAAVAAVRDQREPRLRASPRRLRPRQAGWAKIDPMLARTAFGE